MSSDSTEPAHLLGTPPPRLAAIDLDGTLVDTVPDIAWCIDRTMPRFGIPPRGAALVRRWVGNGVERLVERALTGEPDTPADPGLLREACAAFLDLYSASGHDRSRTYPGVRDGLATLRAHGVALACITNKPHRPAVDLLAHLALLDSFDLVLGGDSLPRRKPDPLPVAPRVLHARRRGRALGVRRGLDQRRGSRSRGRDASRMRELWLQPRPGYRGNRTRRRRRFARGTSGAVLRLLRGGHAGLCDNSVDSPVDPLTDRARPGAAGHRLRNLSRVTCADDSGRTSRPMT